MSETVGIREMKRSLSHYLRKVKMGKSITITDRGVPVARLTPVNNNIPQGVLKMVDEGLAAWQGNTPGKLKPVYKSSAVGKSLSEMISEDRR